MLRIEKLSFLFLVFLFPGAFFYHVAVGLNYIAPFLGGYISLVGAAASLTLMAHATLVISRRRTLEKRNIIFLFFLVIFGAASSYHYFLGSNPVNAQNNLLLFVNLTACYLIFKNINATDDSFTKNLISLSLAMSATILYYSQDGVFDISSLSETPTIVANYQTFALAYLPPTILAIVKTPARLGRYALFVIASASLYLNGARSEFVAILIFFITFEASLSRYRLIQALCAVSATAATITLILILSPQSADNRTLRLTNLSEDNSSNVRDQISLEGIEKIANSPLLGDYGNYEPGLYIHNILSAWQDLGLLGFLYFCLMLTIPLMLFARRSLLKRDTSKETALCLGMLAATSILLLYGKYFAYPLVAITLGMISSQDRWKRFTLAGTKKMTEAERTN